MPNKICVTGGLGHIGSKFIHSINAQDYDEVIIIDNLSTQRYSSLFNLPKDVKYRFIHADINECDLHHLLEDCHAVIHLAAITDAPSSFQRRREVELVNHDGTMKVAEACVHQGENSPPDGG